MFDSAGVWGAQSRSIQNFMSAFVNARDHDPTYGTSSARV